MFAGFLRISELLNIRRSDIFFNEDHMSHFIEKSKTDRFREGSSDIIARTDVMKLLVQSECLEDISRSQIFRNCLKSIYFGPSVIAKRKLHMF